MPGSSARSLPALFAHRSVWHAAPPAEEGLIVSAVVADCERIFAAQSPASRRGAYDFDDWEAKAAERQADESLLLSPAGRLRVGPVVHAANVDCPQA